MTDMLRNRAVRHLPAVGIAEGVFRQMEQRSEPSADLRALRLEPLNGLAAKPTIDR